jgi:hypothetical protein
MEQQNVRLKVADTCTNEVEDKVETSVQFVCMRHNLAITTEHHCTCHKRNHCMHA